jgi:hypothetical protein
MFANEIPVLQELQKPFVAFLDASKDAITTYRRILHDAKKKEEMKRVPKNAGMVYIYSEERCKIILDGVATGKYAPYAFKIAPGSHKIRLEKKYRKPYEHEFTIDEYEIYEIGSEENPITLEKIEKKIEEIEKAWVEIYTTERYRIMLDGLFTGRYSPTRMSVPAGTHTIELMRKGRIPEKFEITIEEGETKKIGSKESPITLKKEIET